MGKGGGGHGGLNILPQKSWHVYNFEAREHVRKDEEAAAAAEAETRERALAAERRYRHGVLLERAGKRRRGDGDGEAEEGGDAADIAAGTAAGARDGGGAALAHVNLFEELEAQDAAVRAARAAAPPPPPETHRLGYGAPGVGDGCATADSPWYARRGSSLHEPPRDTSDSLPARVRRERHELAALRAAGKGGAAPALMPPPSSQPRAALPAPPKAKAAAGKKSVEELRAERLAREASERRREAALLAQAHGGGGGADVAQPAGHKRYHAAFGNAPPRRGGGPYGR